MTRSRRSTRRWRRRSPRRLRLVSVLARLLLGPLPSLVRRSWAPRRTSWPLTRPRRRLSRVAKLKRSTAGARVSALIDALSVGLLLEEELCRQKMEALFVGGVP